MFLIIAHYSHTTGYFTVYSFPTLSCFISILYNGDLNAKVPFPPIFVKQFPRLTDTHNLNTFRASEPVAFMLGVVSSGAWLTFTFSIQSRCTGQRPARDKAKPGHPEAWSSGGIPTISRETDMAC